MGRPGDSKISTSGTRLLLSVQRHGGIDKSPEEPDCHQTFGHEVTVSKDNILPWGMPEYIVLVAKPSALFSSTT